MQKRGNRLSFLFLHLSVDLQIQPPIPTYKRFQDIVFTHHRNIFETRLKQIYAKTTAINIPRYKYCLRN